MWRLVRGNFWYCTESIKETLYLTLVRPKLDYAAVAWDPHFKCDIVRLEGVQRASACFYTNDYNWFSSVTSMLNKLDLCTLKERRKRSRLIFMYKIIPNLVDVKINVFFYLLALRLVLRTAIGLRWLDWIFWGGYLPSLNIDYVAIIKDIAKRLTQLYYIKMKISYDLGFIAIGVAMAT